MVPLPRKFSTPRPCFLPIIVVILLCPLAVASSVCTAFPIAAYMMINFDYISGVFNHTMTIEKTNLFSHLVLLVEIEVLETTSRIGLIRPLNAESGANVFSHPEARP